MREIQRRYVDFIAKRPDFNIGTHRSVERARQELNDELYPILPTATEEITIWQHAEVADEMADVILFIAHAANRLGIDLEHALKTKMDKNDERFPVGMTYAEAKRREKGINPQPRKPSLP